MLATEDPKLVAKKEVNGLSTIDVSRRVNFCLQRRWFSFTDNIWSTVLLPCSALFIDMVLSRAADKGTLSSTVFCRSILYSQSVTLAALSLDF